MLSNRVGAVRTLIGSVRFWDTLWRWKVDEMEFNDTTGIVRLEKYWIELDGDFSFLLSPNSGGQLLHFSLRFSLRFNL